MNQSDKPAIAIALNYDGKNAPKVTAKGEGEIADRIERIARENEIPLYEDPILAQVLSQVELGEEIPRPLYIAVAEVLAFTYLMAGKINFAQNTRPPDQDLIPVKTAGKTISKR